MKSFVLIMMSAGVIVLLGQQTPGAFTTAQATAGRTAYQASCANCHGAALEGRNDASQLAGSLFVGSWGNRTTADLVGFMWSHASGQRGQPQRRNLRQYRGVHSPIQWRARGN